VQNWMRNSNHFALSIRTFIGLFSSIINSFSSNFTCIKTCMNRHFIHNSHVVIPNNNILVSILFISDPLGCVLFEEKALSCGINSWVEDKSKWWSKIWHMYFEWFMFMIMESMTYSLIDKNRSSVLNYATKLSLSCSAPTKTKVYKICILKN
jgi:hypothetical protein